MSLELENQKPKVMVGFRTYNMGYNCRYMMIQLLGLGK